MGKLLVKFGLWIQLKWSKLMCLWNGLLLKMSVQVEDCPNNICKCK